MAKSPNLLIYSLWRYAFSASSLYKVRKHKNITVNLFGKPTEGRYRKIWKRMEKIDIQ